MISKPIVGGAGALLFLGGVALNFLPQETAAALQLPVLPGAVLLIQVLSSAMLALGALNWLSKGNMMGGIYSRPLALADFLFFGVSAVGLDRAVLRNAMPVGVTVVAVVVTLWALAFLWLLFLHDPVK